MVTNRSAPTATIVPVLIYEDVGYTALDYAGHRWTFSLHIADVAPEDWGAVTAGAERAI